jgi:hypothetical protein
MGPKRRAVFKSRSERLKRKVTRGEKVCKVRYRDTNKTVK